MTLTIDTDHDLPRYSPICTFCVHQLDDFRRCKAFRDQDIPLPIWTGDNPHQEPYPGDNGLRFVRRTDAPEPETIPAEKDL